MSDFLFEIGLEEIPARMIAGAEAELLRRTLAMLGRERLLPHSFDPLTDARAFSTPRRLAIWLKNILDVQPGVNHTTRGPAVAIAFRDGKPTPAAEAFARKCGISVDQLGRETTPKGDHISARWDEEGRPATEVIASELPKELAAIYWAKSMYWRAGKPERFVRPVRWMMCLLGESIVPVEFGGKTAARASVGHRVLSSGEAFEIVSPESYLAQLEGEFVLADVEARRHKIRKALDHVMRAVPGARWREDEALVDTVTHLTEWPDVLLGDFEAAYLELPEEVLVTVMRDHQKYFAVEDGNKKLAPHFLAVVNIALDEKNAAIIKQGNERVLRARFNDARFFWEFDQRTPLAERVKLLENVTFQKDLGSYAKKSERIGNRAAALAAWVNAHGASVDVAAIDEAAVLAKTDLTTELVKEFTELQGIIGGLYAASQGVGSTAAHAIYDQYLPASASDPIPRSPEGAILGLADRIDTISGLFGLGMEPTGSKDPFALRRAANAIVRILAEGDLPLLLSDVLSSAQARPDVELKLKAFFAERVDFYLREVRGQAYDVVKAVMAPGYQDIRDTVARAEAVTAARGSEDFLAVSAAFKRMKNILVQAGRSIPIGFLPYAVTEITSSELALYDRFVLVHTQVGSFTANRKYLQALEAIATLRPQVDAFFKSVMVNDPDEAIRERRFTLLEMIVYSFAVIADFSEIVAAG